MTWIAVAGGAVLAGGVAWYLLNRTPAPQPVTRSAPEAAQSLPLPSSSDPSVTAPVADDVVKAAIASLVQVESASARGTGFFSAADVVTTSRGSVGNAKSASVTLPDGRQLDATVIASADQYRLVQLRVPSSSPAWLPASPMRDARNAEAVARLTWPQGAAPGAVKGLLRDHGVEVFQTDLPVHAEDDGSPVIDRTGRVAAVVSAGRMVAFDAARAYFR